IPAPIRPEPRTPTFLIFFIALSYFSNTFVVLVSDLPFLAAIARIASQPPKPQPARSGHRKGQPLGPFHHLHPWSGQQLVETEPGRLLRRKPVKIDVDQTAAAPLVLADEVEGRRLHLAGVDPQPLPDTAGEHGLAAAQLTRKQEDAVRRQLQGQSAPE